MRVGKIAVRSLSVQTDKVSAGAETRSDMFLRRSRGFEVAESRWGVSYSPHGTHCAWVRRQLERCRAISLFFDIFRNVNATRSNGLLAKSFFTSIENHNPTPVRRVLVFFASRKTVRKPCSDPFDIEIRNTFCERRRAL
jgi:hypothetical protein